MASRAFKGLMAKYMKAGFPKQTAFDMAGRELSDRRMRAEVRRENEARDRRESEARSRDAAVRQRAPLREELSRSERAGRSVGRTVRKVIKGY